MEIGSGQFLTNDIIAAIWSLGRWHFSTSMGRSSIDLQNEMKCMIVCVQTPRFLFLHVLLCCKIVGPPKNRLKTPCFWVMRMHPFRFIFSYPLDSWHYLDSQGDILFLSDGLCGSSCDTASRTAYMLSKQLEHGLLTPVGNFPKAWQANKVQKVPTFRMHPFG